MENNLNVNTSRKVRDAKARIEFEDDPHRAAVEDNPEIAHVSASTWLAVLSLSLACGPAIGLAFVTMASVVEPVSAALGDPSLLPWILGAWALSSVASFAVAGQLSDVFGRRPLVLAGEALVTLGCIVASAAQDMPTLISGETIIGFANGPLFVAYAGVPEMLPNRWRLVGLALLEAGVELPWGTVGTLLGNLLEQNASWRWIFIIGVILEFIALVGTALFYWPNPRPRADYDKSRWQQVREIDWIGIFFFTGGSTTFVIGLTWGGSTAHPWKSAGTIAPILIGFFVTLGALVYDNIMAKTPTFPFLLFRLVRKFTLVVVVIFIATMVFNSVTPLLPQGSLYMFTNSGIKIGVYSLPNGVMSLIVGVVGPILAHKIGSIKWQLCFGLLLLATFTAATAAAVDPNRLQLWIWLPAFGPPMFVYINLLCYNIVSLHVPHSRLGVAIGLLGTIRSVGGSVGNAIFNTVFQDRFTAYVGGEVVPVALEHGLSASDLPKVIPGVIEYNLGNPHALDGISGITPVVASALRVAVRTAYGRAFRIVFLSTLAPTIVGLICGCLVEDPTPFMTNHIQSAMLATLEHAHDDERDPEQDLKRTDEITEEHLGLQGEAT